MQRRLSARFGLALTALALTSVVGCQASSDTQLEGASIPPRQSDPNAERRLQERQTEVEPGRTMSDGDIVAVYQNVELPSAVLMEFLIETRGLDALLNLMQLELARAGAAQAGVTVTAEDVEAEALRTVRAGVPESQDLSEEELERILAELLSQQQLSEAEFGVIMETNANLRAMAEPAAREMLTDDRLNAAYRARFGEQVEVRALAVENAAKLAAAQARIDAGESFADVAADVSLETGSRQQGGMLPPFTRASNFPEAIKAAAFELQVGELSGPIEALDRYWLLKLEGKKDPVGVKFEDVKDQLREQLATQFADEVMEDQRRQLAASLSSQQLIINEPVLAAQLQKRLDALGPREQSPAELSQQLEAERNTSKQPATAPATTVADAPATPPATQPAAE